MSADALREALAGLEARWSAHGVDLRELLGSGVAPDTLAPELRTLGFAASDELTVWFSWQGGDDGSNRAVERRVGPAMDAVRLREALEVRLMYLGLADEFRRGLDPDLEPPDLWDPSWLPVINFGSGGSLAVECGAEPTGTSPVWRYETSRMPGRQIAGSLAELVAGWNRLIDDGWWVWDGQHRRWTLGPDRPPEDLVDFQI
ncbi:SMI1/KNR4 family protein [Actinomarinicola tropica]|uniref:Knr4/Smi1-like domain-containing protein n=1 Tax=Actinomarinicola tropica TaxID=2789776 RepID=A0A5Q2RRQ1_9ACTN|nr:hypothetical protein [Actinomarinicola tropica]QGG95865.1 hypothetical protein GH723_12575 [Actinomarinicola tropica]